MSRVSAYSNFFPLNDVSRCCSAHSKILPIALQFHDSNNDSTSPCANGSHAMSEGTAGQYQFNYIDALSYASVNIGSQDLRSRWFVDQFSSMLPLWEGAVITEQNGRYKAPGRCYYLYPLKPQVGGGGERASCKGGKQGKASQWTVTWNSVVVHVSGGLGSSLVRWGCLHWVENFVSMRSLLMCSSVKLLLPVWHYSYVLVNLMTGKHCSGGAAVFCLLFIVRALPHLS